MSYPLVLFSLIVVVLMNLYAVHADDTTTQATDNPASSNLPAHGWPPIVVALTVIAVLIVSVIVFAIILHQRPFGEDGIQPCLPRLLLGPNLSYDDFSTTFGLDAHNPTGSRGRGVGHSRDGLVGNV